MKYVIVVLTVLLVLAMIFFIATPSGRAVWNNWWHDVEKAGENTSYENRKMVEDTCRAMIASYQTDKLTYEQYKNSENAEQRSWAEQARMRANKTANTYNEYVLKNSYIWDGNVPTNIDNYLPTI
jgi:hypothetical protein